VEILYSLL